MLEQRVYKNYKELCGAMGWEIYSGGDAKKKQLKELNNLCNYHKQGHKFIIDEVFENPILVFDNKRSQIMNELQTMIFYLALKEGGNELIISKNRLLIFFSKKFNINLYVFVQNSQIVGGRKWRNFSKLKKKAQQ